MLSTRRARFVSIAALLALGWLAATPSTPSATGEAVVPLIPREDLFSEPERENPSLSPDGTRLAWLERMPSGAMAARVVTIGKRDTATFLDEAEGAPFVQWAGDGRTLLFQRQREGDENWHLWALDTKTRQVHDLTPFDGVRADEYFTDPRHPHEVLVGLNRRDPRVFDLWRVDLRTRAARFDTRNPGDVTTWAVDHDFQVRAAVALDPKTSDTILLYRQRGDTTWRQHQRWPFALAGMDRDRRILGFRRDGNAIYVQNGIGSNTSRILETELGKFREREVMPADPRADLWNQDGFTGSETYCAVLLHPRTGEPQAAASYYLKPEWVALDPALAPDLRMLATRHGGAFDVMSRDTLDRRWIVRWERDTASGIYELYDRSTGKLTPLFESNPALGRLPLAPMQGVIATARDGRSIPCYLTLPAGQPPLDPRAQRGLPSRNLPMIVMPHGGPWSRDGWGYKADVQWLANRGYAVLQPQFRGSTGFGLEWLNGGDLQFGDGRVLTDILDATQWAVQHGVADSTRLAIMGGSFGGYATLCALAFAPDRFRCGVDLVGPSDLGHLISTFPPYWEARRRRWLNRMGDVLADSALNRRISPLYHADSMRAPLLVGHGVNDPRVKLEASERIVATLRERGRDVTFVVYSDEGHGFARPENMQDFSARVEEFFAKHLGGRAIPRADVPGSTAELR